ncbi:O-antigen ligase family protein, partial [Alphaproteobacteria bacterium]|nr:O-antigen ligase family protein [Alphaproteobacteria bacterium]
CFGLVYIFVFVDGFYQYFTGFDIFGYKWDGDRLSGFFGEEKVLGSFLSRTYPFFFGLASYYSKNKFIMVFAFVGFILSDVLVVLSGDRTAAFYLLISSIIIIASIRKFQLVRIFTILISSILVYVIIINTPEVKERIYDKTVNEFQKVTENVENNQSAIQNNGFFQNYYFFTSTHHGYLLASLKMFKDYPILGIGPKLYRQVCENEMYQINNKNHCNSHPHNTYAQLLAETGLVTTLIILMLWLFICFKLLIQIINKFLYSKYILSDQYVCFLTCVFITLFPLIPTGNFFGNWLNAIYYLPLGFIMYEITKNNPNENFISN